MTDRFNALVVVLDRDMRDDDAQYLIDLISHLKGVQSVAGNVTDFTAYTERSRAVNELWGKLVKLIEELA